MTMRIRKARKSDIESLINLWWQMHTSHYAYDKKYYKLASEKKAREATRKHFLDIVNDSKSIFLVAEEKNMLIGSLNARITERPPVFTKQIVIMLHSAIVDENHRGRGVFSKLQKRLEKIAHDKGARYIMLTADIRNPAVEIYRKKGYRETQYQMVKKLL